MANGTPRRATKSTPFTPTRPQAAVTACASRAVAPEGARPGQGAHGARVVLEARPVHHRVALERARRGDGGARAEPPSHPGDAHDGRAGDEIQVAVAVHGDDLVPGARRRLG